MSAGMRIRLAIVILLFFLSPVNTWAQELEVFRPVHVIFDLDWTLFYSIDPSDPDQVDEKMIQFQGKSYRLTDHTEKVLLHLLKNYPEVKISFFSGGQEDRNLHLLRSIRIDAHRTALDVAEYVFSFNDLELVAIGDQYKFATRYKKLVEKLIPNFRTDDVILIDDKTDFASPELIAVPSLGTMTFTKNFKASRKNEEYLPPDKLIWRTERDKALVWLAHLEKALTLRRSVQASFSQSMRNSWTTLEESESARVRGMRLIRNASCLEIFTVR